MANPFTDVENALVKAGSFLLSIGKKAVEIFDAQKPAEAAAIVVFGDVESFISLAAPAAGAEGLNFAADSAAYVAFLRLVADAKAFAAAEVTAVK